MKLLNKVTLSKPGLNGTCMDCIFWYQCRQGKVDCSVKTIKNGGNTASA